MRESVLEQSGNVFMKEDLSPECAGMIRRILTSRNLSQAELAETLGVSPATISRWLSGSNEPTPQAYVALGNLAAPPDNVFFWEHAGVQLKQPDGAPVKRSLFSSELHLAEQNVIAGKRVSGMLDGKQSIVAIPLLGVCAYADEHPPHEHVSLARASVEEVITAPAEWCPHPDKVIGMHVCGESMFPTMQSDAIIFVDLAITDRHKLDRQIIVVSHRNLGFKVARLQHLSDCFLLVPSNHSAMPIDITNASKWTILGRVLWWVTRDHGAPPAADSQ